jgi:two-component system sensor histidine kinase/response regulator
MTANAMEADKQRCLEAGMNDHIAKPIEPRVMLQTIHRHCEANATDTTTSSQISELEPTSSAEIAELKHDDAMILDVNIGLKHTNDNPNLLLKLYDHFVKDHQEPCTQALETAASAEDKRRWAHTLKGNAAALGAKHVAELAKSAEDLYKTDQEPTADLIQELETAKTRTLALMVQAREQLGGSVTPTRSASLSPEALASELDTLLEQLEHFDPAATDTFSNIAASLKELEIKDTGELEKAIQNFDFAIAAELAITLKTRIAA